MSAVVSSYRQSMGSINHSSSVHVLSIGKILWISVKQLKADLANFAQGILIIRPRHITHSIHVAIKYILKIGPVRFRHPQFFHKARSGMVDMTRWHSVHIHILLDIGIFLCDGDVDETDVGVESSQTVVFGRDCLA